MLQFDVYGQQQSNVVAPFLPHTAMRNMSWTDIAKLPLLKKHRNSCLPINNRLASYNYNLEVGDAIP